jgi:hypothetical protein
MKNKEVTGPKIFHNTPGIYVWIIQNNTASNPRYL